MSKTVWKTVLTTFANAVVLPINAQPISVGWQRGSLVLWSVVDPEIEGRDEWEVVAVLTGGPVQSFPEPVIGEHNFLGTVQAPDGLVYHVFNCGVTRRNVRPLAKAAPASDDAPDLTDTKPLPPPSWMGA